MIVSVLVLALLPTTLFANPERHSAQNVVGFDGPTTDSMATATLSFKNQFKLDTTILMRSWRGSDKNPREEWGWESVPPGTATSPIANFQFNTLKVTKDWERWQIGVKFQMSDWTIWTREFSYSPSMDDPNLVFSLGGKMAITGAKYRSVIERIGQPGSDFPKDALDINSYFFLEVENNSDGDAKVDVGLKTRSDTWKQKQEFCTKRQDTQPLLPLPFFFESACAKSYAEVFSINVFPKGGVVGKRKTLTCELDESSAGVVMTLSFNNTGCSIRNGDKRLCDVLWEEQS